MLKSELYDYILPFIPGVETPLVDFAIMRAVQIAAEQSGVLREAIDVPIVPGISRYALIPSDLTADVSSVVIVRWYVSGTNVRIYPITDNIAEWMTTLPPSNPTAWRFVLPAEITVHPVPNEAGFIRAHAILKPIFNIPGPISDVWRDYMPMIADGAMSLLYAAPGKPWSSSAVGDKLYASFAKSVLALRVSVRSGGMPNNATMTGIGTFGSSQQGFVGPIGGAS